MKNLLKISDLSYEEIIDILNLADQLKFDLQNDIPHEYLKGRTLGMIFGKVSTRTRVSFQTGMYQLGGQAIFMPTDELQLDRGESMEDTARTLSRYLDAIVIRNYDQEALEKFSEFSSVPVINGLTNFSHPCQVIADLLTIREYKNRFEGIKLGYIGDGNNMANSLIVGALKVGMKTVAACPENYLPDADVIKKARRSGDFELCSDPLRAAKDADVLVTDSWFSMGQDEDVEAKKKVFENFRLSSALMEEAKPDCMVLHCLPACKGMEIDEEVFEAHAEEIFDETENRLHAQKAILVKLLSNGGRR
jgi:ornithine carbamoyltransferase